MKFESYSQEDLDVIKNQLSSNDLHIKGIVERCKYGHPRIVLLNIVKEFDDTSKLNYQALSNLMWLTCPNLNNKIHDFENQGLISKITNFIRQDTALRSMMKSAHANFYFLRNFVFSEHSESILTGKPESVFKNGVGGIQNLDTLKCLHIHFCHYRIFKNNIAGLLTYKLLNGELDCADENCRQ